MKNGLAMPARSYEAVVNVPERLSVIAGVRNVATHRAVPSMATVNAFRRAYYQGFEAPTGLAG